MSNFDVIIAGGGIVGTMAAISLGQIGFKVLVVEKGDPQSFLKADFDGRVSAVSLGSQRIMQHYGIWPELEQNAGPIWEIRVCEGQSPMFVHFDHENLGDEPLGYMIENRFLRSGLYNRMKQIPNITFLSHTEIAEMNQTQEKVTLKLSNSETHECRLLIAADGRGSKTRESVGIKYTKTEYNQTAIVCMIKHEKPHYGVAVENFFPAGPFAVLPCADPHLSGVVWTESTDEAPNYLGLNEKHFSEELGIRLGDYLGGFEVLQSRWSYPLSVSVANKFYSGRVALAGDSAHGIHPIAGQGANVGFRDVAALAELLEERAKLGLDIGASDLLARYERWRRFDSTFMAAVTDGLNRLFVSDFPGVKPARLLGMAVVNRTPILKNFLMKNAMGLVGKLPESIRSSKN